MNLLKQVWFEEKGNHLDVVHATELQEEIPPDVLDYMKQSVVEGVSARYKGPRQRVRAKPHASLINHLQECTRKAVKT